MAALTELVLLCCAPHAVLLDVPLCDLGGPRVVFHAVLFVRLGGLSVAAGVLPVVSGDLLGSFIDPGKELREKLLGDSLFEHVNLRCSTKLVLGN